MIGRWRKREIPQAFGLGAAFQVFDERQNFPTFSLGELFLIERDRWTHMFRHESGDAALPMALPR